MKHYNRMRAKLQLPRVDRHRNSCSSVEGISQAELTSLAPPLPIRQITPDEVIEDILLATLSRVQCSGNAEIVAAADRYIQLIKSRQLQA